MRALLPDLCGSLQSEAARRPRRPRWDNAARIPLLGGLGRLVGTLLGLLALAGAGCSKAPEPLARGSRPEGDSDASRTELPRLRAASQPANSVLFSGCLRVLSGPVCEVQQGTVLTLWQKEPFTSLQARIGTHQIAVRPKSVAGGYQVRIVVPTAAATASKLVLASEVAKRFELQLADSSAPPLLAEMARLKDAGKYEEALALSRKLLSVSEGTDSLLVRGMVARVRLRQGDISEALATLQETSEALAASGNLSDAARDAFAALYLLLYRQHRIEEAARWLERWQKPFSSFALGAAWVDEQKALFAVANGDLSSAIHHYSDAEVAYHRIGMPLEQGNAAMERMRILGEIGSVSEALARLDALPPIDTTSRPCSRIRRHLIELSLRLQQLVQAGPGPWPPAPLLHRAQAAAEACGDPHRSAIYFLNEALWFLQVGKLASALRSAAGLRGIDKAAFNPYLRGWVAELEGRLALARDRQEEALTWFEREVAVGRAGAHGDTELRGLVGLAQVHAGGGGANRARELLEQAIRVLEAAQALAPFGPLAHTHFAVRQQATQRLVAILLASHEVDRAYEIAMRSYRGALSQQVRGGAFRQISPAQGELWRERITEYRRRRASLDAEARGDWGLPKSGLEVALMQRRAELDALQQSLVLALRALPSLSVTEVLPEPDPGQVWLLVFPLENDWVIFTHKDGQTRAWRVPRQLLGPNSKAPAKLAIETLTDLLPEAGQVVVLAAGRSRRWKFEEWTLGGRPLGEQQLAFGAGLGPVARPSRDPPPNGRAVVADSLGDLPFARAEGEMVARLLKVPADRAIFGKAATASSVLSLLERSKHLHWAGHARMLSQNNSVALALGAGGDLEAWELFSLDSVPFTVVLAACISSRANPQSVGLGWGLAQVFLGLGSGTVIAANSAVRDASAQEFQQTLYKNLSKGIPLRESFWKTKSLYHKRGVNFGSSFRLYVR